jgi:hypothetical protein
MPEFENVPFGQPGFFERALEPTVSADTAIGPRTPLSSMRAGGASADRVQRKTNVSPGFKSVTANLAASEPPLISSAESVSATQRLSRSDPVETLNPGGNEVTLRQAAPLSPRPAIEVEPVGAGAASWRRNAPLLEAFDSSPPTPSETHRHPSDENAPLLLRPLPRVFTPPSKGDSRSDEGGDGSAYRGPRVAIGRINVEVVPAPAKSQTSTSVRPGPLTAASVSVIGSLSGRVRMNRRLGLRYR